MISAVFGSFDPPTLGHMDVIGEAAKFAQKCYVVVSENPRKRTLFNSESRQHLVQNACAHLSNVEVVAFSRLAAQFCQEHQVDVIFRGVRTGADVDPENALAYYNYKLAGVTTLYVPPPTPKHIYTSSSAVRELLEHGQSIDDLVPDVKLLQEMYHKEKNA